MNYPNAPSFSLGILTIREYCASLSIVEIMGHVSAHMAHARAAAGTLATTARSTSRVAAGAAPAVAARHAGVQHAAAPTPMLATAHALLAATPIAPSWITAMKPILVGMQTVTALVENGWWHCAQCHNDWLGADEAE
eukprot:SAG31_NODE_6066_length_2185_cov_2.341802_2_plen_137_part_00